MEQLRTISQKAYLLRSTKNADLLDHGIDDTSRSPSTVNRRPLYHASSSSSTAQLCSDILILEFDLVTVFI